MKDFYVYLLIDPRNNKPFYAGKGRGYRISEHERLVRTAAGIKHNQKLERKIRSIWRHGLKVIRRKVYHGNEADCLRREIKLIAKIGLNNLCNLTPGGIGGDLISNRFSNDPAMRKKWRDVQMIRWTKEARREFGEKIRHAHKTRPSYRAKQIRGLHKMWESKERRLKQQAVFKKYWSDPKNRRRQSINSTRNWHDPEIKKRREAGFAKRIQEDPLWHKKRGEKIRAYWAKPGIKEKRSRQVKLKMKNPAFRERLLGGLKRYYADPANRNGRRAKTVGKRCQRTEKVNA